MKKIIILLFVCIAFVGCAPFSPVGGGSFYTDVTGPIDSGVSNQENTKTGESSCLNILGLVAYGDCSIAAAKVNGGITEVGSVDGKSFTIWFFYSKFTTIVKGN